MKMRTRKQNKKFARERFRGALVKWHGSTRERLIRTGFNDNCDTIWGCIPPNSRFDVDQSQKTEVSGKNVQRMFEAHLCKEYKNVKPR